MRGMTPLEIIRRKKNPRGDSCLPPADRLLPVAESAGPRLQPASPCDACGCPAHWLDRRGVLRCGGCQPPPFSALVDCWLLAVWVPLGPFGGGNVCEWEYLRPRFDLARRRKKPQPDL